MRKKKASPTKTKIAPKDLGVTAASAKKVKGGIKAILIGLKNKPGDGSV